MEEMDARGGWVEPWADASEPVTVRAVGSLRIERAVTVRVLRIARRRGFVRLECQAGNRTWKQKLYEGQVAVFSLDVDIS